MSKHPVRTSEAPAPGGAYSQGMRVGRLVFTAGLGPQDPVTGQVVGTTIEEQTEQVLKNLQAVLRAAGSGLDRVVKMTVHLQHLERDFAGFNATYARLVPDPKPVRTTVGSQLLGILVEIDAVAECDEPLPEADL